MDCVIVQTLQPQLVYDGQLEAFVILKRRIIVGRSKLLMVEQVTRNM